MQAAGHRASAELWLETVELRIDVRPDAELRLPCGPNEAGKNLVLAAIGDLLFGFPQRKDFDFLGLGRRKSVDDAVFALAASLRPGRTAPYGSDFSCACRRSKSTRGTLSTSMRV